MLGPVRYPRESLIDWSNPYSLNNWVNQIDLYCASSFEIGLFGSMFFFGYLISCVVFPPLADVYGRKPFVLAVCIMHTLCFLSLLFIPSLVSFYATIFVFGAMGPLKNMIAYTHLMEFLPSKVSAISGFIFFIDDFLQVICPLVLMYLTTNTNVFLWAGVVQNVLALASFAYMYIPESTKFLLEKGNFEDARKDIQYLMKFNGASEEKRAECESILERYIIKQDSIV